MQSEFVILLAHIPHLLHLFLIHTHQTASLQKHPFKNRNDAKAAKCGKI